MEKNAAIQALITISTFPITDPKNMDALNIRKIAVSALAGLKEEVFKVEPTISEFKTKVEKRVWRLLSSTLGLDETDIKLDSNLKTDLHVDRLDMIEFQMRLEEDFGHVIEDNIMETFHTPRDVINFINSQEQKQL